MIALSYLPGKSSTTKHTKYTKEGVWAIPRGFLLRDLCVLCVEKGFPVRGQNHNASMNALRFRVVLDDLIADLNGQSYIRFGIQRP